MEKITIVLLIIGFIILPIALYFIFKKINSATGSTNDMYPNNEYMEKIGAVCPTGWVYKGESAGNNICENYYKLPISDTDKCYNNKDTKVKFFSKINDWQKCQDTISCKPLKERCDWIKNCGPSTGNSSSSCNTQGKWKDTQYAAWLGVADKC